VSNGIDFVIGGKNNAGSAMDSANDGLAKLEEQMFAVKLQSQQMAVQSLKASGAIQQSAASIKQTVPPAFAASKVQADNMSQGISKVKIAANGLMATLAPLLALLAVAKTAMAAVGGIKAASAAYDAQTESIKKLNAALQIRGASEASKGMQDVAKSIEKMTGVSDNAALALMQQASGMGFATGKMDDAAKAAIGLGAAMGKDSSSAMGDLKAALEGNFDAFAAVNPQIMYMRTNQERLAAVMAIANQGLAQQAADMTTVAGSGRRADSAMSTLMESIGKIIAPIRVLINAGLQQLATSLDSLLAPAVEYATDILANIGPVMDWVKEKVVAAINIIVGAFTFLEVIVTNLGSVWEIAKAAAELAMITISESVMHAFTQVIPAYVTWWKENFVNILRDAFGAAYAIVTNHISKIVDAMAAMWDFIESGGTTDIIAKLGEISGRSYLEGFETSMTSLPEIAGRQLTEREKDLAEKIGAVGGRLGEQFSDKMKERMLGVGSTLSTEVQNAASSIDLKMRPSVLMQGTPVTEGRLLTRGPGMRLPDQMQEIIRLLKDPPPPKPPRAPILVQADPAQMEIWRGIESNTSNTMQMEAIV